MNVILLHHYLSFISCACYFILYFISRFTSDMHWSFGSYVFYIILFPLVLGLIYVYTKYGRNSSNLFVVSFFHLLTIICCFVALNTFVASVHFAVHLPSGGLACTPQDFLTSCSTFQVVRSTCMLGILNHECLLQFWGPMLEPTLLPFQHTGVQFELGAL